MRDRNQGSMNIAIMFREEYETLREAKLDSKLFTDTIAYNKGIKEYLSENVIMENLALYRTVYDDDVSDMNLSRFYPISNDDRIWDITDEETYCMLKDAVGNPVTIHQTDYVGNPITDDEMKELTNLDNFVWADLFPKDKDLMDSFRLHRVTEDSYIFTVSRDSELNYIMNQLRTAFFTRVSEINTFDSMVDVSAKALVNHLFDDPMRVS